MTAAIRQSLILPVDAAAAFSIFTDRFEAWWPREYTWSQAALETIGITPHEGGLCFEIGPHGFRCDWGRVLAWDEPNGLVFTCGSSPLWCPPASDDRITAPSTSWVSP